MTKASAARKLAAAAAYGGGGLGAVGAMLYGLLRAEAKIARHVIGVNDGRITDATGWYGRANPGPAVKIALLGDSSSVGYGMESVKQTPGAFLGSAVAAASKRRVHLRQFGKVGARSEDLAGQVDAALPTEPDVAVIFIGANDVTHTVPPKESVRLLSDAVRRFRAAGVDVIVGTCPDLGTIRPIPPPLRQVARAWSRRLAAAQTIAVVEEGGRTVSLGSILGPEFDAAPALLFGPDRFHPSAAGYEAMIAVVVPSVLAAIGVLPDDEEELAPLRTERILPITKAAVMASRQPGTELDATDVDGSARGFGGRWVTSIRRRLFAPVDAEEPQESEESEESAAEATEAEAPQTED